MSRAAVLCSILWGACAVRVFGVGALLPDREPVPLRVPFSRFPMDVFGPEWRGEDVPLEDAVEKRAKVTSYIQRQYARDDVSLWLYVGYVSAWSPESIHNPDVCFPGSGFEVVSKGTVVVPEPSFPRELRFKEFLWKSARGAGVYTLSTFCYNGKLEPEELRLRWDSFRGVRCFAVITLSGVQLGTLDETRKLYFDLVRRSVPRLVEHIPQ
ncbi:MAG: exosortase-associated EpsI family protein [Planctomycetes bacterium]|nr:exosortase-associated EpsI family protein [Planctomycetota bacterium]